MKKMTFAMLFAMMSDLTISGQTLEKMNWYNEPASWQIDGGTLTMDVTPNSDYWRISHYGFTVDDAPFYYAEYLDRPVEYIWIKAVRRLDAVEIFYSFDDKEYKMMRNAWVEANHPVRIGMFAACPDGKGFKATFSDFKVTHLPDKVRSEWLKRNAE